MQIIPIQPIPAQVLSASLNQQATQIVIRQKTTGVFVDVYVDDALIVGGVIALNCNVIVRSAYLGFVGDIAFVDTQATPLGPTDPVFTGFGDRFVLAYFLPSELPMGVA